MQSVSEFLSMGGYGAFVWAAYLIAAAVMVGLLAMVLKGLSRNRETLKTLEAERQDFRASTPSMDRKVSHT